MIWQNHCNTTGMFSTGKINPLSRMVGSIRATSESIIAICWLLVIVEMSIPSDSAIQMKSRLSNKSRATLPTTGTPNTVFPRMIIMQASKKARKTYGKTFPIMIWTGLRGETRRSSIVPSSFSRVIESEVIRAEISISSMAIRPGTNINTPFISLLYIIRTSGTICMGIFSAFSEKR